MSEEDFCKVCGQDYTEVREMFFGIPITPDYEVRVNICKRCLNEEEFKRMTEAQSSGEGDDWYHFELHEKEVTMDGTTEDT